MRVIPTDVLPIVSVDGGWSLAAEAQISALDRGFLVADGIFETLYVCRGAPIALMRHLDRLAEAARFIRLAEVPSRAALIRTIEELIVRNEAAANGATDEAALRLTVSRGPCADGPPTVVVFMRELSPSHLAKRTAGVAGHLLPSSRAAFGRDLANHKTLAYLSSVLGQLQLAERTTEARAEGFFQDADGAVLEGTASNVFTVSGDVLRTPPLTAGILPGTSRAVVIELAAELGVACVEGTLSAADVKAADEVFMTSSTLRVAPVVSLDGVPIGSGRRGPMVERLQAAFEVRITAEVAAFRSQT